MTHSITPPLKISLSRGITLAALTAMVMTLVLSRDGTVTAVLLLCLPLTFVLPGLILQWYRSYSWLSLMILLYFIIAVTRAMAPEGNWADNVFVALTVTIFWSSAFGSRWLQRFYFELQSVELNEQQTNITQAETIQNSIAENNLAQSKLDLGKETP